MADALNFKGISKMAELTIGSAHAGQYEKAWGFLPIEGLPEQYWPPVVIIRGKNQSPLLTVTGGIHGCEYSSIEAAKEVAEDFQPQDLNGTVVVCSIANLAAFFSRRAFLNPLDDKNLNRSFPGDPTGSPSQRLAYHLAQSLILPADAYIDLHGGDIVEALVPFTLYQLGPSPEIDKESRSLALQFGIPIIIRARTPGSTCECAVNLGKPAILAEAGQQGILSSEAVKLLKRGVCRVLNSLGSLTEEATDRFLSIAERKTQPKERVFLEEDWVRSPALGLWYPAISCGDSVEKGQVLGQICNFFGEILASVKAEHDGLIVFLLTSLAVNEGDALLAIAHSEEV